MQLLPPGSGEMLEVPEPDLCRKKAAQSTEVWAVLAVLSLAPDSTSLERAH